MSEESVDLSQQRPLDPNDLRQSGPGGGHQPATFVDTNRPVDEAAGRHTDAPGSFHVSSESEDEMRDTPPANFDSETPIEEKLAYARKQLGDDVYILLEGSEVFNATGLRLILGTPAVVKLSEGSNDPRANDQRFASFLFPSDVNWGLNIGQLERPFNRATCAPLPLMCEKHGEDVEWEPYGAVKICPKCAQEALAAAAEIPPAEVAPASETTAEPTLVVAPITVGSVVKLKDNPTWPTMSVLSVEFGLANCEWYEFDGARRERAFGLVALRLATEEEAKDFQK